MVLATRNIHIIQKGSALQSLYSVRKKHLDYSIHLDKSSSSSIIRPSHSLDCKFQQEPRNSLVLFCKWQAWLHLPVSMFDASSVEAGRPTCHRFFAVELLETATAVASGRLMLDSGSISTKQPRSTLASVSSSQWLLSLQGTSWPTSSRNG